MYYIIERRVNNDTEKHRKEEKYGTSIIEFVIVMNRKIFNDKYMKK